MKRMIGLAIAPFFLAPATAHADSSIDVGISAHVDPFCHIYPAGDGDIQVEGGSAMIGQVKEICNTPDGYTVAASFSNVSRGELQVGGQSYAIDAGIATRSSLQPAVRTMTWRLADAQLTAANLPVVMQVTITPRWG